MVYGVESLTGDVLGLDSSAHQIGEPQCVDGLMLSGQDSWPAGCLLTNEASLVLHGLESTWLATCKRCVSWDPFVVLDSSSKGGGACGFRIFRKSWLFTTWLLPG